MDCSDFVPLLPGAAYAGALHVFISTAPIQWAFAAWAVFAAACSGAAGLLGAAVAGVLAVLGSVLAVVVGILTSNATQIILAVAVIVAWQVLYPSKWLLAVLSRVPYCNGVAFDFCPADAETAKRHKKYVALTLDDGPCPYNSEPVLDLLAQHNAHATFFIIGGHVEQCDVRGAGDGHAELGKATLRRMVAEGHELGNHTWHDRPSHKLTVAQLSQEISDVHQLITSARQVALAAEAAANDSDDELSTPSMANTNTNSLSNVVGGGSGSTSGCSGRRFRWFRPGGGWFTPEMVEAAQKLGYRTVLGSVWPWDTHSTSPLLNSLYIISKVYSGAVIVLHDRRRHLLPTLQYVLPWLAWWGYEVVNLGEAATRSIGGSGQELTSDVLEALNADTSLLSGGGATSTVDSVAINPDKLKMSASYLVQMAKERERAAIIAAAEEAERQRIKAEKRAAADRRAGIDRRLVDMSAAEKRAIERREREKKEAEKRRAKRKADEIRAKERYDEYVRQKAEDEIRRREEDRVAAIKAKEAGERRKIAEEEHKRRTESQRAAAAEMVARMKTEQEAAEAAAAGGEITAASTVGGSTAGSTFGDSSVSGEKKKKSKLGFLKKLGGKIGSKKSKSEKQGDDAEQDEADADAAPVVAGVLGPAAAAAAVGAVAVGASAGASWCQSALQYSSFCEPHTTYAWYGLCAATPERHAALEKIDAALAAQTAAISEAMLQAAAAEQPPAEITADNDGDADAAAAAAYRPTVIPSASAAAAALANLEASLPAPAVGDYARGPSGKILLGFDAQPLLMAHNPDGQAVVLNSQGQALTGPGNEQLVLLLGAHGTPLVDPHGRPVFMAVDQGGNRLLGVHPDGSIIMVPSSEQAAVLAAATAAAVAAGSDTAVAPAAGDSSAAGSGSEAAGSIKEPDSYAPSLARSSIRSSQSAAAAAGGCAAGGLTPLAVTPAPAMADYQLPSPTHEQQVPAALGAEMVPASAMDVTSVRAALVPATLLLGPQGKPLLGLDNRPLIVAVDEEGVPLALSSDGHVLLGLDDKPLQLAYASDGSLVALDSQCRPLSGPDGKPRVVALDRDGRPMLDEAGRPVLLALGPNGLPLPDSTAPSARVSWAGSASGARLSHSGTQGTLAGGAGTGLEVMVCSGEDAVGVVDAADYGEYSAAAVGVGAMSAAAVAAGAGCYLAATSSGGISASGGTAVYGMVEEDQQGFGQQEAAHYHQQQLLPGMAVEQEEHAELTAAAAPPPAVLPDDDELARGQEWELQQYKQYQQQQQQQHVATYQLHHPQQEQEQLYTLADGQPQPGGGRVVLQRREAEADEAVAAAYGRVLNDAARQRDQIAAAAAGESGSGKMGSSAAELLQMVEVTASSGIH